ncbi:hypothetical protein ACFPM3_20855 [Streptomyces coeruleoprunus]|uniref:Uncharacterized protein n=1 Tax=Streptomyces coeruleoprunus TaxID=285563 RepID=A0ABV9XJ95_9ACTN
MSVLVADTAGVSYAEIRAGELHRLRPVPGDATRTVGTSRRAVRHERGLSVLAEVRESDVPLLAGSSPDASDLRPVPVTPGGPAPVVVNGVAADGTALATVEHPDPGRLQGPLYALPWGAAEWRRLRVPDTFSLLWVAGSDGGTVYVVGATGAPGASSVLEMRPALFAVDVAGGGVAELPLPARGPERPLRDRLRLESIDPSVGRLEHGAFRGDVLVANASYGEAFEYEVLHAVDRRRGTWSTARLRRDDAVADQWVDAHGTAYAVTSGAELWTSRGGGAWQRLALRPRLAGLLGVDAARAGLGAAAFVSGRLLMAAAGAIVSCAPDGTDPRVLCRYGGDVRVHTFVRPPAGAPR